MTPITDAELYLRGIETVVASWGAIAAGSHGAAVVRAPGVAAAVFPEAPARRIYNNAVLERGVGPSERADALDAMEDAYASAGVDRFAAWVHESDEAMRAELAARGYTIAETTRAMGMELTAVRAPRRAIELAPPEWPAYLSYMESLGVPQDVLGGVDPSAFHLSIARLDGENVATALAFDLGDDCGIYNVSTLEHARRRGLGTELTALLAHEAAGRGCRTASLQSTAIAERVYAALGFRDLGLILEHTR